MDSYVTYLEKRIDETEGLLRILKATRASEKRLATLEEELKGFHNALLSAKADRTA